MECIITAAQGSEILTIQLRFPGAGQPEAAITNSWMECVLFLCPALLFFSTAAEPIRFAGARKQEARINSHYWSAFSCFLVECFLPLRLNLSGSRVLENKT